MSVILRAPTTDRLVRGKPKTYITVGIASASATLTVESINGFAISKFLIVGNIGEERTEVIKIHTATPPSGSTITLATNTVYRHEKGTPVFLTDYDQVRFYRDTETDIDAAVFADATALAAASTIQVDQMESIYDDTTNTTGHGFYQFQNSATAAVDTPSDPIPYTGFALDAADSIIERALSLAGESVNPNLRYEDLFKFLSDYVAMLNSKNTRWSEAKVLDHEMSDITAGVWEYTLPSNIAKNTDPSAIINLRLSNSRPLTYIPKRVWNQYTVDLIFSRLSAALLTSDVVVDMDNSAAFADNGTVMIKGDSIAYTGNTRASERLTGVTGVVAAGHSIDDYVFQQYTDGVPSYYTVFNNKIRLWPIPSADQANEVLYADYYQKIPKVNSLGDRILITNIQSAVDYMAYRIKRHVAGGSLQLTDEDYQKLLKSIEELVNRDSPGEPIKIRIE